MKTIRIILKKTFAINKNKDKAIIWHPTTIVLLTIFFPIIILICLFTEDNFTRIWRESLTFKIK